MPCSIFLRCLIISLLLSSSEGFFANEARQQRRNVAASPLYLRSKSLTRHPRVPFSSLFSASTSFDTIHSGKERNKQNIITAMLAVSYMSVIISVMTLPPCLAYLDKDKTFAHKHLFPTILFIATLSTMLGKFLLGPPTDTYGGNKALKGIMASNILLLILCSLSNNSLSFGALWIVLQFFYAAAWGACSKLVRSSFPPSLWSNKLALVAAASRLGSLGSSFIFGGILAWKRNWRHTFICSALLQSAALLFYQLYDRKARLEYPSSGSVATLTTTSDAVNASSLSEESSSKLLQRVIRQPQFWSMLAGKIALMTVGQFISFIPLYLNTGAKLESSRAAIFAASFSVICF